MPFPIDEKYIRQSEVDLNVVFPSLFKIRMRSDNGGTLKSNDFDFNLYPYLDKSSGKRISRTCNHIVLETRNAKKWDGFPPMAIAIGTDGIGNKLILLEADAGKLEETIFFWDHESGEIKAISNNILELESQS